MKNIVFVYGTLKRGYSNNVLMKNSEYLGLGITTKKYAMYENGIPYVCESKEHTKIVGEVYKVDKQTLKSLDSLEGHPEWYKRKEIKVVFMENQEKDLKEITAWIYFMENTSIPIMASINNSGIFGMKDYLYNKYLK